MAMIDCETSPENNKTSTANNNGSSTSGSTAGDTNASKGVSASQSDQFFGESVANDILAGLESNTSSAGGLLSTNSSSNTFTSLLDSSNLLENNNNINGKTNSLFMSQFDTTFDNNSGFGLMPNRLSSLLDNVGLFNNQFLFAGNKDSNDVFGNDHHHSLYGNNKSTISSCVYCSRTDSLLSGLITLDCGIHKTCRDCLNKANGSASTSRKNSSDSTINTPGGAGLLGEQNGKSSPLSDKNAEQSSHHHNTTSSSSPTSINHSRKNTNSENSGASMESSSVSSLDDTINNLEERFGHSSTLKCKICSPIVNNGHLSGGVANNKSSSNNTTTNLGGFDLLSNNNNSLLSNLFNRNLMFYQQQNENNSDLSNNYSELFAGNTGSNRDSSAVIDVLKHLSLDQDDFSFQNTSSNSLNHLNNGGGFNISRYETPI